MEVPVKVVIFAQRGLFSDSLVSYLISLRGVQVAAVEEELRGAPFVIQQHQPQVIILEIRPAQSAEKAALETAGLVRLGGPQVRCIVLVDTLQQQTYALEAGAHAAILKGFLNRELDQAVFPQVIQ